MTGSTAFWYASRATGIVAPLLLAVFARPTALSSRRARAVRRPAP